MSDKKECSIPSYGLPAMREAMKKCEQFWNERSPNGAEFHAILEFIHGRLRTAFLGFDALTAERDELRERVRERESEILRIRTTENACAVAIDRLGQFIGLQAEERSVTNVVGGVESRLSELREMLRELEWSSEAYDAVNQNMMRACPICGKSRKIDHTPDCRLAKLLGKTNTQETPC